MMDTTTVEREAVRGGLYFLRNSPEWRRVSKLPSYGGGVRGAVYRHAETGVTVCAEKGGVVVLPSGEDPYKKGKGVIIEGFDIDDSDEDYAEDTRAPPATAAW